MSHSTYLDFIIFLHNNNDEYVKEYNILYWFWYCSCLCLCLRIIFIQEKRKNSLNFFFLNKRIKTSNKLWIFKVEILHTGDLLIVIDFSIQFCFCILSLRRHSSIWTGIKVERQFIDTENVYIKSKWTRVLLPLSGNN